MKDRPIDLSGELSRRGWPAWVWSTTRQEQYITAQIRGRIDPDVDPILARLVVEALLDGVSQEDKDRLVGMPLWGYEPGTSPGPDLALIDDCDRVLAVIEHKIFAAANAQPYVRFDEYLQFTDPLALSLPPRPGSGEVLQPSPWLAGHTGWHLWQIDYYRCNRSWLRNPLMLDDAGSAVWLLLDWGGRQAATVFPGSHTAHVWQTTGYYGFVRQLLTAYDQCEAEGAADVADQLKDLIRMALS